MALWQWQWQRIFLLALWLVFSATARANVDLDINPADKVDFQADLARLSNAGTSVAIDLRLVTHDNFTLYIDKVSFNGPEGFSLAQLKGPTPRKLMDPIMAKEVEVYDSGDFELKLNGLEAWTKPEFPLSISFTACTEIICLFPFTQTLKLRVVIADTDEPTLPSATPAATASLDDLQRGWAERISGDDISFGLIALILFAAGLLTNLTPCVFPMIPITLRLLSRQGLPPLVASSLYALGILLSYTALGLIVGLSGGVFGALSASPAFNLGFALVMAVLGLSMLGFGDLSRLQNIGARLGGGQASGLNTLLMGVGAGLVASPCTGPILAALLASAARTGDPKQSALYLFIYSAGFALPYVLLGSVAANISRIKVAPVVQVATKVLFAAVMFALSCYYLRIPLYAQLARINGHWGSAALFISTAGLLAAIAVSLSPRLAISKSALLGPSLILGLGVFAGSQWATGGDVQHNLDLVWYKDEAAGIAAAKASGKPILIDGWAEWCEACKKMDRTTFIDPELGSVLAADWILIKLDLTEMGPETDALAEKYGLQGLPTLVLLPGDGRVEPVLKLTGYISAAELLTKLREYRATLTP